MAQTGERIRRACRAPMPADYYDRDDSASMIACTLGEGHDGPHRATINRPRTVEWTDPSGDPAHIYTSCGATPPVGLEDRACILRGPHHFHQWEPADPALVAKALAPTDRADTSASTRHSGRTGQQP